MTAGDDEGASVEIVSSRVVTGVYRAESLLGAALAPVFRAHGTTAAGFNVMMILDGAGRPLCPHDVSERRSVTRGTVTGVLDSLERNGWLRRLPNPADRRSLLLELTDEGRSALRELLPQVRRAEAEVLGHLGPGELCSLADGLELLAPPGAP